MTRGQPLSLTQGEGSQMGEPGEAGKALQALALDSRLWT